MTRCAAIASALLVAAAIHSLAQPQQPQQPQQLDHTSQFAASCARNRAVGVELANAVLYKGKIYCADGAKTTGTASPTLWTKHQGRGYTPRMEIVAVNEAESSLPNYCTYLPGHVAFIAAIYWPQIGHFMYNTVAELFSVLGLIEAHAAGPNAYMQARSSLNDSLQVFMYPDMELDAEWRTTLWQSVVPSTSAPAEIFRVFTKHPVLSLPALIHSSNTQAYCFEKLAVGLEGATLDHYMTNVPAGHWILFRDAIATGLAAEPIPRCQRAATNVVIVRRKGRRLILNMRELEAAVNEVFGGSTSKPADVRVVAFEDLLFSQQIQLMATTDVLIGMDGTGLFNGNFMPKGSYVVRIKPYALDILFRGKSTNFKRIWQALGIHQLEWGPTHVNQTQSSLGAEQLQAVVAAAHDRSRVERRWRSVALQQDTVVDVAAMKPLLLEVVQAIEAMDCDGNR